LKPVICEIVCSNCLWFISNRNFDRHFGVAFFTSYRIKIWMLE